MRVLQIVGLLALILSVAVSSDVDSLIKSIDNEVKDLEQSGDEDVQNDLEEASGDDDNDEYQALEEASGDDDYQVLEEASGDDEYQALEEASGDDDDDDDSSVTKVSADVRVLEEAIKGSSLSRQAKREALTNLAMIESDTETQATASRSEQTRLRQAIKDRMAALRLQLGSGENALEEDDDDDDDDDAANAVLGDIRALESQIISSDMSDETRQAALSNLQAIQKDTTRVKAGDASPQMSQAIRMRMKALRMMLEEEDDDKNDDDEYEMISARAEDEDEGDYDYDVVEDDAQQRVSADIRHLEEAVSQSSLPASTRRQALDNLQAIRIDANKMARDGESPKLRQAMHLRMQALHQMVGIESSFEEDSDAVVARVSSDVRRLEQSVKSASLPYATRSMALDNLKAIAADASRLSEGGDNGNIKEALNLRMQALRQMLSGSHVHQRVGNAMPLRNTVAEARVKSDVQRLEQAIIHSHMPSYLKKEAKANAQAILRDAEEMQTASAGRAETLKQALALRIKAMREQAQE